ncbi:DUF4931 domain-containing protein [Candidatus Micrarchaeota archaeon]|nr:DUF4931 domain-containing protein [Candidatus Micrarchaeota archaeon]
MPLEFRTEKTKDIRIIVASKRSKRPHVSGKKKCPFDKGNEAMTPPSTLEVITLGNDGTWKVRSVENKFPFLSPNSRAFGVHEVIIETPRHREKFEGFEEAQLLRVFEAYKERYSAIYAKKGIRYVFLFKNYGKQAGASIDHEHTQIVGLPFIPELAEREFSSFKRGKCPYCSLSRQNVVFRNKHFSVVRPTYARFPLECWIIPHKHVSSFTLFDEATAASFMSAYKETVRRVKRHTQNFNAVFHNSCKKDIHFHVEVYPKTTALAGLELGAGVIVNTMDEKTALEALKH